MHPFAIVKHAMVLPRALQWKDLLAGVSAMSRLGENWPVGIGAASPLQTPKPEDWSFPFFPRAVGLVAQALADLQPPADRRYGLVLGLPNLFSETDYLEHTLAFRDDASQIAHVMGFSFDHALDWLAARSGATGPRIRIDSACATGADALITAAQWLELSDLDDVLVVAGGAMLNPVGLALFNNLKALSDEDDLTASRPFDRTRKGFVMGEGACAVWLSKRPPKEVRGWLCGYGQSMNADNFVDLPEDLTAMETACRDALNGVDQVAYVSAHGTGTPPGDRAEIRLHQQLFGRRAPLVPISSVKSMIGHTLGAAALIEAVVCVEALHAQQAPPTINHQQLDDDVELNVVPNQAQPIHGDFALSNAFAFGGHNAALLFSRSRP